MCGMCRMRRKRFFMKKVQKVLLLASVMSAFTSQEIFASEVASSEIAREIAPADNERERERVTPVQSLRSLGKWILAILSNPKRAILQYMILKCKILICTIQNHKIYKQKT